MESMIHHFDMHFRSEQGSADYPFSVRIEPEQTRKRIACYSVDNGSLSVGIRRGESGSLKARELLGNLDCRGEEMWCLPDERDLQSLPSGRETVIVERCLPSIGTEATSLSIDALRIPLETTVQNMEFVSAQKIVDRAFCGKPVSFDLLFSVMSLALEYDLPIKTPIIPSTETRGEVFKAVDRHSITKEELEFWRTEAGGKTSLTLEPMDAPPKPFIKGIFVEDLFSDDAVEIAYRKGSDAVDIGAYAWHRGRIYIPIKIGSRPAKALMDQFKSFESPWCDIDGVAGSVEPHETEADLQRRALIETEEELGMLAAAAPQRVGSFFSLPQSATERVTGFTCEVNPDSVSSRSQGVDETVSLRFIELDQLMQAFKEGIIQDGRFVLSAMLIKQAFHYHDPYCADICGLSDRIALLGGTFDPLQNGHLTLARETLANDEADTVLIVPAKQNKLKGWKPVLPDEERLATTIAAASSQTGVYVSDLELRREGEHTLTADTISELKTQNPNARLIFIMGSDLLTDLHRWDRVESLFSLLEGVVVYERDGFSWEDFSTIEDLLSEDTLAKLKAGWRSGQKLDHSSTEIRRALSLGKLNEVQDNVPEAVFDYLKRKPR